MKFCLIKPISFRSSDNEQYYTDLGLSFLATALRKNSREVDEVGKKEKVFSKYIDPKNNKEDRKWHDEEVDLSKYAGQAVEITFTINGGI